MQKHIKLDTNTLVLILIALFFVATALLYLLFAKNKKSTPVFSADAANTTMQIQLQAYERLILLTDRIALPNLISRVNIAGASARELQYLLTQSIKEEYDHNITQQIYVSADSWRALKNLKEQNMLIINQFANILPANATGMDLNKMLIDYMMNDKKGSLHDVVSEVLSYEVKKVLNT